MKKLFALMLALVLSLTVFSLSVFAEEASEVAPSAVEIKYDKGFSDKITFDGDISEWSGNAELLELSADSFTAWVGNSSSSSMKLYFAVDDAYIYIAADITDATKCAVASDNTDGHYRNHDAFQLSIDLDKVFASCADDAAKSFSRSCFYSFAHRDDGKIAVTVDEAAVRDCRTLWADETGSNGIMGACADKDGGWTAELAISIELLRSHAVNKLKSEGESKKANELNERDLNEKSESGLLVCYLDYNEDGQLAGAFGTGLYADMSDGVKSGFRPENHGIKLVIPKREVKETEASTEAPTEAQTENSTSVPTETESEAMGDKSTEKSEKSGCGSSLVIAPIALVAVLGTALTAKIKKED